MTMMSIFVSVTLLLFQLNSFGCAADNLKVPPFNISQKALKQYLSLNNLKIDLPAIFVFGDSNVEAGNNNYMDIYQIRKTNHSPYGVDFGGKPTGRCTNGRTVVDFIAQATGLPFPPPVLGLPKENKKITLTGINYASGFSGIIDGIGHGPDAVLDLRDQIDLFENTTKHLLQSQFRSKERLAKYLSKSLFFISTVAFDLGYTWDGALIYYSLDAFTQTMIDEMSKQLKRLYELGARKILVNNAPPIGCQPFKVHEIHPTTACVEEANMRARVYNIRLASLLKSLQSTLPGSKFVLADLYNIFQDVYANPSSYGFTNVNDICCAESDGGSRTSNCDIHGPPTCEDRSTHVFFDPWNPSESMHFVWARRLLKDSSICSPISLIQLIET